MLLPQALVVEDPEREGELVPQLLTLGVAVGLGVLDNEEVEQPLEDPEGEIWEVPLNLPLPEAAEVSVTAAVTLVHPLTDPLALPLSVLLGIEVWEAVVLTVEEKEGDRDDEPQELKFGVGVAEPQAVEEAVAQAVAVLLMLAVDD